MAGTLWDNVPIMIGRHTSISGTGIITEITVIRMMTVIVRVMKATTIPLRLQRSSTTTMLFS